MNGPLHKSGVKTDPNNFRGLAFSSCLGKLFNSMLRQRLERKCVQSNLVTKYQASGKSGAQTLSQPNSTSTVTQPQL